MTTQPGQKMGKGMLLIMWILILIGLTFYFSNVEESFFNPNTKVESQVSNEARTVILKRNKNGHYVATGKINGRKVVFFLDTGATTVAVPTKVAEKLGLRKGAMHTVSTANGMANAYYTRIPRLELGAIVLEDVPASINPGMLGEDILLGMSVLTQLDFSQSGDELTLQQYIYQ